MALPSCPPPESLPARGVKSSNSWCPYSDSGPCSRRWWSRHFTRVRFITQSIMAHSTYWPRPVRSRWMSAARIPAIKCTPVPESPICAPVTTGGPSNKPEVLIAPPIAWATFSYALKAAYGPSEPKPLIEAMMIRGLISWTFSHPKPSRSRTPGPKFSIRTSQVSTSFVKISLPLSFFKFTVIDRLLQLSIVK